MISVQKTPSIAFRCSSILIVISMLFLRLVNPVWADSTQFNPTLIAVEAKGGEGGVPVGTVVVWPYASAPSTDGKWLECNGQSINPVTYPELAAIAGATVPDYRGIFLRGFGSQNHAQNNGTTIGVTTTTHSSGNLGQMQGDASRPIYGRLWGDFESGTDVFEHAVIDSASRAHGDYRGLYAVDIKTSRTIPTANENRPANKAVRYFIRALP